MLRPKGRMTKPLATPYEVGDRVRLILPLNPVNEPGEPVDRDIAEVVAFSLRLHGIAPDARRQPVVGDVGVIRRIRVADANDGDKTFVMHDVKWLRAGRVIPVGLDEIAPVARKRPSKGEAWLQRQLATLNIKEDA
jgi:hypothetical protein